MTAEDAVTTDTATGEEVAITAVAEVLDEWRDKPHMVNFGIAALILDKLGLFPPVAATPTASPSTEGATMNDTATAEFVCPEAANHGNPFRYCPIKGCGWIEPPEHKRDYAGYGPDDGTDRGAFCPACSKAADDYVWPCRA